MRGWFQGLLRGALVAAALLLLPAQGAQAQLGRLHRNVDANGVDLAYGDHLISFVEGSIGSGESELALVRNGIWYPGVYKTNNHQWDRIFFSSAPLSGGAIRNSVNIGSAFEQFDPTGTLASGSSLAGSGGSYVYRTGDGTEIGFGDPSGGGGSASNFCNGSAGQQYCSLKPMSITSSDGKTVSLEWDIWVQQLGDVDGDGEPDQSFDARIARVTNSFGYSIEFTYASGGSLGWAPAPASWHQRTSATFHNSVAGTGALATVSYSYPATYATQVTDTGGRVWRFEGNHPYQVTGIRRPGASSDTTTISYTNNVVTSVTRDGVTTGYSRSVSGTTATMVVTNALSQTKTVVSNLALSRPTSVTDGLNRTTSYQYDTSGRLTRVTAPEGNYVQYTLDSRGNATQAQMVPKSGSGQSTITVSATYPSSCTTPACNQPTSTTDARGNVTDYTYDSTHGGPLTVTLPAPTTGAVRPQTRYAYTLTNGEYQLTEISACQTQSSCSGAADETKTTVAYDANGNVTSVTQGNGTGSLSVTQSMTYDSLGNLATVDGPLSGSADTLRYRYNGARQTVGMISPDPDGAGPRKHRASRRTYVNGLLTRVENGTVNSQSDSDWSAYSSLETAEIGYDAYSRPVTQKLLAGGTAYALVQTGYDAIGRAECVATRMNPAAYSSLPSSACSLGTQGSHGPDRIARSVFDAAGQQTQLQTAYGTSLQAADWVATYSDNGKMATLTDGESNRTTFEYDGHDRPAKTRYPVATKGASSSSTTDYEQLTYDAGSNLTSRRLRDGNSIGFSYDALNRLIGKDLPGSEPDVSYSYDALSRMTGASQTGNALTFAYDALSRATSAGGPQGTTSSVYDAAGRRTRITHADGFYVDQDYLVTGEVTAIRENGATSGVGVLASYAYDDLGRRASLTRGNGTVTSYGYDAVSRLSTLTEDLAGTSADLSQSFTYNPASQIATVTRSNDNYAWSSHYNLNRNYSSNGLNQYSAAGSVTPSFDARGNLTAAGGATYAYSSENLLTSASGGISLAYDPMRRLYQTAGGSPGTTRFAYDGTDLIAEHNGSNAMLRRYVHGPGSDEPLVWYEGSGTTDRRFLHADERGSVVATSNSSGATLSTNAYDEYGIPKPTNTGRFQYTGQTWLPELGMYHYKARLYSPTLGRFLQTDPIGYGDGMNLYAYVGNDPVNARDPTGMCSLWAYNVWDVWNGHTGEHWQEVGPVHTIKPRNCDGAFWAGQITGSMADFDASSGGAKVEDPCNPKPTDRFNDAAAATIAAARATAIRNNQNGTSGSKQEFHADVTAVPGGFSFEINNEGRLSGGKVGIQLNSANKGSAHNHEASDSYDRYPDRLSWGGMSGSRLSSGIHDVKSYTYFFDKFGKGFKAQLHIAIAGPDGRIYYWEPGRSIKKPGKDAGPTLCPK